MRLGIDFGTTHTVIALVDRGNYPIASFEWGDAFPSVIAIRAGDGEVRYGHDAEEVAADPDFTMFRSFKRLVQDAGPLSELVVGASTFRIAELFTGYLARLKKALLEESNAGLEGSRSRSRSACRRTPRPTNASSRSTRSVAPASRSSAS